MIDSTFEIDRPYQELSFLLIFVYFDPLCLMPWPQLLLFGRGWRTDLMLIP